MLLRNFSLVFFYSSSSSPAFLIIILYLVNLDANLTFCPFLPIANEEFSSFTIAKASLFFSSIILTSTFLAGLSAFCINLTGSLSYKITSIQISK